MRTALHAAALSVALLFASRAHASPLAIRTPEHGDWATTVAWLQMIAVDGDTLHVEVVDGSVPLACGTYALTLDTMSAAALQLGACDPRNGATDVVLRNRHALFAHDGAVARPLDIGIAAIPHRPNTSARTPIESGSSEHCTIEVHPFVVDPETHARVAVTAPAFAVRIADSSITATATGDGWTLGTSTMGELDVTYDIVDVRADRVLATEHAQLSCGGGPIEPSASVDSASGTAPEAREAQVVTSPSVSDADSHSDSNAMDSGAPRSSHVQAWPSPEPPMRWGMDFALGGEWFSGGVVGGAAHLGGNPGLAGPVLQLDGRVPFAPCFYVGGTAEVAGMWDLHAGQPQVGVVVVGAGGLVGAWHQIVGQLYGRVEVVAGLLLADVTVDGAWRTTVSPDAALRAELDLFSHPGFAFGLRGSVDVYGDVEAAVLFSFS